MSFDLAKLVAVVEGGPVARVVVSETRGSVPREAGTAMLVRAADVIGTIGGGALEYEAIARARKALGDGNDRLDRIPLGPGLGQCCGGAVTLLTEVWDSERLGAVDTDVVARPLPGVTGAMPLSVSRALGLMRREGRQPTSGIVDNWMIEPVQHPKRQIWIWGAGHVGRALVGVLAPVPDVAVTWADTDKLRFPQTVPDGVDTLIAANPADLVTLAPSGAEHLVLTYSHALDLDLCHRILSQPHRWLGLIGSETKRARFRSRLRALGHGEARIARMVCPIGDPTLGKHPQMIALGVAADMLRNGGVSVRQEARA